MSVLDKFLNVMKLNDTNDYDDDFFEEDDDYIEEEPIRKKNKNKTNMEDYGSGKDKAKSSKVLPIRQNRKSLKDGMEVCVIRPTTVEDAREITETLLSNSTVVLNLEGLDVEIAQRIIDFTSGSCFSISGNLQKISNYIFIITPPSVDISGDFQEIINGALDVPPLHTTI